MLLFPRVILCAFFLATAVASLPSSLPAEAGENPGGPPFSDPSVRQSMPEEWKEKPVSPAEEHAGADIVVNLNQQFYEFMVGYIEDYARENGLRIEVLRGTCGTTAGMLEKKEVNIGGFCCPPAKIDRLPGVRFHTVGVHPVSILVHPDNPVEGLTFSQVRSIFGGKSVRWTELGWKEFPIQVIARLHCKKRPGHWRLMLDKGEFFAAQAREVGAIEDMFALVSTIPSAIGYEVMWMSSKLGEKVKILKIDGRHPSDLAHLLNGEYPLYRAAYLTTWEAGDPAGPEGEKLAHYVIDKVEEHGLAEGIIPVSQLRKAGWSFRGGELTGEPGTAGRASQ